VAAVPRWRGVTHAIALPLAAVATVALVAHARPHAWVTAVFGGSMCVMFGVSALYHRGRWSPRGYERMKRLDHAAIFVSMAGGSTPLFALAPSAGGGYGALVALWIGAALGIAKVNLWPGSPRWLNALVYCTYGSLLVSQALERVTVVGPLAIALFAATGLVYAAGAVVYALRRPDPLPEVFGHHEVFHLLIVAGSVSLFAHVAVLISTH
jgi:hemolysin III